VRRLYKSFGVKGLIKVTPSFMCIRDPFCDIYIFFYTLLISGIEVFDTCGMRDVAMRDVYYAVKNALEPRGKLPLLGKYSLGKDSH
jgi:hypothetical protein